VLFFVLALTAADCAHTAKEVDAASELYAAAQARLEQGATGEGVKLLKALSAKHPWFAAAYFTLAQAEDQRNGWLWAYTAYKRYLDAEPHTPDQREIKARLSELENKVPALKDFADGERALTNGNFSAAAALFEESITKKPSFALAYRFLGLARGKLQQQDKALAAHAKYAELDPEAPDLVKQ
jgi:outer membrane protein assembly factor BamD (BamD/ComL family)